VKARLVDLNLAGKPHEAAQVSAGELLQGYTEDLTCRLTTSDSSQAELRDIYDQASICLSAYKDAISDGVLRTATLKTVLAGVDGSSLSEQPSRAVRHSAQQLQQRMPSPPDLWANDISAAIQAGVVSAKASVEKVALDHLTGATLVQMRSVNQSFRLYALGALSPKRAARSLCTSMFFALRS
jgi:hypothetical protein